MHVSGKSNDLILSLTNKRSEDLIGEVVGLLSNHFRKKMGRELTVNVSNNLHARQGGKNKPVMIQADPSGQAVQQGFMKGTNGGIVYSKQPSVSNGRH